MHTPKARAPYYPHAILEGQKRHLLYLYTSSQGRDISFETRTVYALVKVREIESRKLFLQ